MQINENRKDHILTAEKDMNLLLIIAVIYTQFKQLWNLSLKTKNSGLNGIRTHDLCDIGVIGSALHRYRRGHGFESCSCLNLPSLQRVPTSVHPPFPRPPIFVKKIFFHQLVARQIFYVHVSVNISGFKFISLFGIFPPLENHKLE